MKIVPITIGKFFKIEYFGGKVLNMQYCKLGENESVFILRIKQFWQASTKSSLVTV